MLFLPHIVRGCPTFLRGETICICGSRKSFGNRKMICRAFVGFPLSTSENCLRPRWSAIISRLVRVDTFHVSSCSCDLSNFHFHSRRPRGWVLLPSLVDAGSLSQPLPPITLSSPTSFSSTSAAPQFVSEVLPERSACAGELPTHAWYHSTKSRALATDIQGSSRGSR